MANRLVCDQRAAAEITPLAERTAAAAATPAIADALARSAALSVSSDRSAARVAWTWLTSAKALSGTANDLGPNVASSDVVDVVAVRGPAMTDGSPRVPAQTVASYAVLYDVSTATVMETCYGSFCGLSPQ